MRSIGRGRRRGLGWRGGAPRTIITEVPGIPLTTGTLALAVIDHVHVPIPHVSPDRIVLCLTNSTRFPALAV